jgi:hypothetical protein
MIQGKEAYSKIREILDELSEDVDKFYVKQVNAPGSRLRKGLKNIADIIRSEKKNISELKNSRKKEQN